MRKRLPMAAAVSLRRIRLPASTPGSARVPRHTARRGWTTDEDAPKRSLADALAKAASWLGVAAGIRLGR